MCAQAYRLALLDLRSPANAHQVVASGLLQRDVAVYCDVLQGGAGCCRVLQGVAGCCRVLQGVTG